eukprot:CAMPEP_0198326122 /NCGR_PEP_ID=MMETSP1450-20131203/13727_1 /TAXON_ID=753684 ORGANISM="Madagascaria erythrocladiodes, Strain CCMP3234" /NCGR_SAMPLE_ID=MMETSP1450 /ASSEMBLY_ACC=CAM_ASM_001115 /LENGTH=660 /DNA_ID=CAMNT_0044030069 /DNA_START=36 /DNA_END=2018 /DNA_ORIENTATION=-
MKRQTANLVAFVIVVVVSAAPNEKFLDSRLPSGRAISRSALTDFAKRHRLPIEPSSSLHFVESSETQMFSEFGIDLAKASKVEHNFTYSYTFNGEHAEKPTLRTRTMKGDGFLATLGEDGKVLRVSGDNFYLLPLHKEDYPGIFVNVATRPRNLGLSERQTCPTTHFLEVAVAYDNLYCAQYNNNEAEATSSVEATIAEVSAIFMSDLCVKVELVHVEAHCNDGNDPYASFASKIDPENDVFPFHLFRDYWDANRTSVHRDTAHFFSGIDDGTTTSGIASTPLRCYSMSGYGWDQNGAPWVVAHELGHNLNAGHDSSGLMKAKINLGEIPTSFSSTSQSAISTWLGTEEAYCVETSAPCSPTCGSGAQCSQGACVCPPGHSLVGRDCVATTTFPCSKKAYTYCFSTTGLRSGGNDLCVAEKCDVEYVLDENGESCCFANFDQDVVDPRVTLTGGEGLYQCGSLSQYTSTETPGVQSVCQQATPTPTPVATLPPTPIVATKCGEAFPVSQTFSCETSTSSFSLAGSTEVVTLKFQQKFGQLYAQYIAPVGYNFKWLHMNILPSSSVATENDIASKKRFGSGTKTKIIKKVDAFALEIPNGDGSSCCGQTVYVYFFAKVCKDGTSTCWKTSLAPVARTLKCESSCGGSLTPFSASQKCPTCQ